MGQIFPLHAFEEDHTYRLRPDYEQEPEIVECEIKPQGDHLFYFSSAADYDSLHTAIDRKDFIGFKYEDGIVRVAPRIYSHGSGKWIYMTEQEVSQCKVLTPTHCLFKRSK